LASDSVLVLYFTSNWCSECTKQDTTNQEVFNEIGDQELVFLKVHILDSETTSESDALAKKFDIVKENSYVVLDMKGAVAFKSMGSIEKETLKIKILEAGDTK
jgi:peroxiredoxin